VGSTGDWNAGVFSLLLLLLLETDEPGAGVVAEDEEALGADGVLEKKENREACPEICPLPFPPAPGVT